MAFIRRIARLTLTILITVGMVLGSLETLVGRYPMRLYRRLRWAQRWFRWLVRVWGLRVEGSGSIPPEGQGGIMVANHRSYLDVVALFLQRPLIFVAKAEIRRWPVIGPLAQYVGVIFIERDNPASLRRQIEIIRRRIDHGFWICFFPEGRITTGMELGPFRRGLLGLAQMIRRPIHPVVLYYPDRRLEWGGPESLPRHLWRWLGRPSVKIRVRWLEPLNTDAGVTGKVDALVAELYTRMNEAYRQLSQMGNEAVHPAGENTGGLTRRSEG